MSNCVTIPKEELVKACAKIAKGKRKLTTKILKTVSPPKSLSKTMKASVVGVKPRSLKVIEDRLATQSSESRYNEQFIDGQASLLLS